MKHFFVKISKNLYFPFLNFQKLDTTWIYDVVSKSWSEGPKMNTKRFFHACLADEETSSIYVVGGRDDQLNILSSTEKWTLGQSSWQPSANLPETISESSAVSSNGNKFVGYLAGGWTGKEYSKDIFGLRRRDMTWNKMNKTMKKRRYLHSLLNIPVNQVLGC